LPELRYEYVKLVSGRSLWVGETGRATGEAVLLVHGLGIKAHCDWRNVIPALAPDFRVVTLDLPGFDASESLAKDLSFNRLAAILDEVMCILQIERAHVIGHSLGGVLSLHFGHRYP